MSEFILAMLLGHFVGDYILQTKKMVEKKNSMDVLKSIKTILVHAFIHHGLIYLLIGLLSKKLSFNFIVLIVLICLIHFVIDVIKVYIGKQEYMKGSIIKNSIAYILDQIFHVLTIYSLLLVWKYISYTGDKFSVFFQALFFEKTISLSSADRILTILILVIISSHFCAHLLDIILKPIKPDNTHLDKTKESKTTTIDGERPKTEVQEIEKTVYHNESSNQVGKYIGMIERIIIIVLVVAQSIAGIAFLIAIKALTRFKQFEDKRFAEFYLIGSMLSVLFGIILGYFVKLVLK